MSRQPTESMFGVTEAPCPDEVTGLPREFRDGIVRVLNDEGIASGPWDPQLPVEEQTVGLEHMLTVREFDRCVLRAQRQGKTSFCMQCTGEEAIACGSRRIGRRSS